MSDATLGVGIVGLGNIADVHAEAIKRGGTGRVVAATSSSEEKLERFNEEYGARGYTSYEEMLEDPEVDVVSVCTPSGTHLDFGKTAAEAGKHVVVEKPIEVSLERAASLIQSCEANGVKLAVIYQSRFSEAAMDMKAAIDGGDIGELFMATASVKWFRDDEYYEEGGWRGTLELDGGGAVINQSIHTIDLLLWMLGDVDTIQAYKGTFTHNIEAEDNAVATFRLASGALGTFVASTSIVPPQPRKIEVHGSEGTALLDESSFHLFKTEEDLRSDGEVEEAQGGASPMAHFKFGPHRDQFTAIFEAIQSGGEPPVTGADSLRSLAFVAGLYRSAETGQPVSVEELIEHHLA